VKFTADGCSVKCCALFVDEMSPPGVRVSVAQSSRRRRRR